MWWWIAGSIAGAAVVRLIWVLSRSEQCRCCHNYATRFYECAVQPDAKICIDCLENWVWAKAGEVHGTAALDPPCFNRCGAHLTVTRLSQYMSSDQFARYAAGVTNSALAANPNILWCPCGAIYELDRARHGEKCLIKCLNCKKLLCAGCGDVVKKIAPARMRAAKINHACKTANTHDGVSCPQCRATISKTVGCNTMRCVICNAQFDYRSGRLMRTK